MQGNAADSKRTHGSSLRELGAPLDQERAASMADEGGAAGAETDAEAQASVQRWRDKASVHRAWPPVQRKTWRWGVLVALGLGLGLWGAYQRAGTR
jgi:hypothetical protein